MNTSEFIATLRRASNKPLVFVNEKGDSIHTGYHLTEIKAAKFDTVDCGGQKNRWNETIMQLWVPEDETDDTFMTAGKFLSIYDKVSSMIDVDLAAEIQFEYGDDNFVPSKYHVEEITGDSEVVRVGLRLPGTTCKARDRQITAAGSCCA